MTKKDLRNGDIIVVREGVLGLYLAEKDVFIYQECGYDDVDFMYNEDLTSRYDGEEFDVMQVYRDESGGVISFYDYEEGDMVFERDETWVRPTKEDREQRAAALKAEYEAKEAALKAEQKVNEKKSRGIFIIAQAFYGNRTGTKIRLENMDRFILGYLDNKLPVREKIDRTIIRVPETENLVIIYNKYQEEKIRGYNAKDFEEDDYVAKPLASIPEENIDIYSRCIVCRMNGDGEFESLQPEDGNKFMKYLA